MVSISTYQRVARDQSTDPETGVDGEVAVKIALPSETLLGSTEGELSGGNEDLVKIDGAAVDGEGGRLCYLSLAWVTSDTRRGSETLP